MSCINQTIRCNGSPDQNFSSVAIRTYHQQQQQQNRPNVILSQCTLHIAHSTYIPNKYKNLCARCVRSGVDVDTPMVHTWPWECRVRIKRAHSLLDCIQLTAKRLSTMKHPLIVLAAVITVAVCKIPKEFLPPKGDDCDCQPKTCADISAEENSCLVLVVRYLFTICVFFFILEHRI